METIYTYTRASVPSGSKAGDWDINNPYSLTTLSEDVESALPGKSFKTRCSGTSCEIIFPDALTAGEVTTLDTCVADHKALTEPDQLENNKQAKYLAIDLKTQQLIGAGFAYDGEVFSASLNAQMNWNVLKDQSEEFTFPLDVSTKNDYKYNLSSSNLNAFWTTGKDFIKGYLDSGRDLKVAVADATNQTELDAVVDDRT